MRATTRLGAWALLLAACPLAATQDRGGPPKGLPAAPRGFDQRRDGIERGKVETVEYDSKSVGAKRRMVVYTPPGYSKDRKYPVFYLLHGAGDDETGWQKKGAADVVLDNLYADKKLVPMIVVMPNGFAGKGGDKGGKKSTAAFEDDLIKDVIPLVEKTYPVKADRESRAIAGLSMGGGQALRIGLKHLDRFAWVGGFSSALFGKSELIGDPDEARKKLRLLWVSCGDTDKLMKGSETFHAALEKMKVPHVWHIDSGGHTWPVWKNDLYLISQLLFREPQGTKQGGKGKDLAKTPAQMEGPFYPDRLPPDTDNDLVIVNNSKTAAKGSVTHLSGKVLGANGRPIAGALVEIWQVDGGGVYLHSGSDGRDRYDKNFQGFGRCLTNKDGEYYFRTLKPVPYPGRTPHIHFIVLKDGKRVLTTQMYVKGEPRNAKDGILNAIKDAKVRESIIVDFTPLKGSTTGELAARFDIVVGLTPLVIDDD